MPMTKVTAKGQITLPLDVRRALGVEAGDRVEFVIENGRVAVHAATHDVRELKGLVAPRPEGPVSIDEMDAAIESEAGRCS